MEGGTRVVIFPVDLRTLAVPSDRHVIKAGDGAFLESTLPQYPQGMAPAARPKIMVPNIRLHGMKYSNQIL